MYPPLPSEHNSTRASELPKHKVCLPRTPATPDPGYISPLIRPGLCLLMRPSSAAPALPPRQQAALGTCWPQQQQQAASALPQQPPSVLQPHPRQYPRLPLQQLQLRPFSVDSEVSRQRLIAAQQRRAREQEAQQRRKAAAAAAAADTGAEAGVSSSSSTELQEHTGGSTVAVVPQESPPADVQVRPRCWGLAGGGAGKTTPHTS